MSDDRIYFYFSSEIYTINLDGGDKKKLNTDTSMCVNVIGDRIYYYNSDDGNKLYAINIDGSGRKKLSEDSMSCINVAGDWIFYYSNYSYGHRLYTIAADGSGRQLTN